MGMFDMVGTAASSQQRKENTLRKLQRMNRALRHEEPDRVPISDFFWGGFIASLANRTWPAGRRQSLLLLRPRLDRHRPQYGSLDSPVRDAQETRDEVVVKTGLRGRDAQGL